MRGEQTMTYPIKLHPKNPRYFIYKDKPTILVTSSEHYGGLYNLDFDFVKYFDELKDKGLNHTRTFSGIYHEIEGESFGLIGNVQAPRLEAYSCPFARSEKPGANDGGNLFDLDRWDEEYFKRLKIYFEEANKRDIIIEFVLFCSYYYNFYENDLWLISPLNDENNINSTEKILGHSAHRLENKTILKYQRKMVKKLVEELNEFDNFFFQVLNEPWNDVIPMDWQTNITSLIADTEKELPKKHLISWDVEGGFERIEKPLENISIYNFHYGTSMAAFENQDLEIAIGNNETGFSGHEDSTYRKQGWEFMMSGGALFNNLDYSFLPGFEDGSMETRENQPGGGSKELRSQLGILKSFLDSLDFINMRPDNSPVKSILANYPYIYLMHNDKDLYAGYILCEGLHYIILKLEEGSYRVSWLDTVTGQIVKEESIDTEGKELMMIPPKEKYIEEIAFKVEKSK